MSFFLIFDELKGVAWLDNAYLATHHES